MAYTVDESDLARQQGLADVLDPITERRLGELPLPQGATCLDVGCGLGRTTRMLVSELAEPERVVGVDADPDLLAAAREGIETGSPMEFREADAGDLPFEDDAFDVVFGRFLLAHVPEPETVVEEYRRVARDGGWVVVQEPDFQSLAMYPSSSAHQQSKDVASHLFDTEIGRKCWHLLRDVGLCDLQVRADVPVEAGRAERTLRDQSVRSISAIGPALLQQGIETEAQIKDRMEGVRRASGDDDRFMMYYTTVSVAGRG